jgi:hypothetical protein
MIFGGHLTLAKHKIVDCGAFCEVIFFYISAENLLGDFFDRFNAKAHWEPDLLGEVRRHAAARLCGHIPQHTKPPLRTDCQRRKELYA